MMEVFLDTALNGPKLFLLTTMLVLEGPVVGTGKD
jgi:hypothetical protein